ncbi:hypothetical protein B0F90DRAFT_1638316, partial [Multifurca ochricompacta]
MSNTRNASNGVSSSTFLSVFDAASKEYKKKTGQDLHAHPFAAELNSCDSPDAVLGVFQKQADVLDGIRKGDEGLVKWLNPIVHILYLFSGTLGEGVGLTFSPAKTIFTGIGVLLTVAKDVTASYEVLADLFERIESFLSRLKIYSGVPLTAEMTKMLGKIMAEVLCILSLATKEMKQRRIKSLMKRLVGRTDVEDALQRLDKLTLEELRMVVAKNLEVAYGVDGNVKAIKTATGSDARSLLSSILTRLCEQSNHCWNILSHLYFTHLNGSQQPSEGTLAQCLKEMLNTPGQPGIFLCPLDKLFILSFRFRWVFCQLDTLRRCIPASIRLALDELPVTLDETYERTLVGIPEEKWEHAHRLFQCLIGSVRPLRVDELAEIFAIQFDQGESCKLLAGWRPEDAEDAVLSACSSLIAVVESEDSRVVQFSHFSVKEFLISNRLAIRGVKNASRYHIPLEPAHTILARACLTILLNLDDQVDKDGLKNFPLAFYAAENWVDH